MIIGYLDPWGIALAMGSIISGSGFRVALSFVPLCAGPFRDPGY